LSLDSSQVKVRTLFFLYVLEITTPISQGNFCLAYIAQRTRSFGERKRDGGKTISALYGYLSLVMLTRTGRLLRLAFQLGLPNSFAAVWCS
jgi:hypothetical protein